MARFKNEKGLTLIELLITISVLAVVSAIALPVINNVVASSNSNALQQTIKDADAFINKYSKSGVVAYDGLTQTFKGYVDTDGDNTIDQNELVDTLTLDAKFSATASGTSPSVGGSYSNGGVTGATITAASGASTGTPTAGGFTGLTHTTAFSSQWFGMGTNQTLAFSSYNASTRTLVLTQPLAAHGMCLWDLYIYDSSGTYKGRGSSGYGGTTLSTVNDGTTCTYTADFNVIEASSSEPLTINPATDIFLVSAGSYNPNAPFTLN